MTSISFLGCGAVGSRIAVDASGLFQDCHLHDNDRVTDSNIGTSVYRRVDIGKQKPSALANIIQNSFCYTYNRDFLTYKRIATADVYVDAFDNPEARNYTSKLCPFMSLMHVGVAEGVGEIIWGGHEYIGGNGGMPICTHQLGIPVIALTSAVAVAAIHEYIANGARYNYIVNVGGDVRRV